METARQRSSRIPAARVVLAEEPAVLAGAPPAREVVEDGRIAVAPVVEGGVVQGLRIRCACGAATELVCEYESKEEAG